MSRALSRYRETKAYAMREWMFSCSPTDRNNSEMTHLFLVLAALTTSTKFHFQDLCVLRISFPVQNLRLCIVQQQQTK